MVVMINIGECWRQNSQGRECGARQVNSITGEANMPPGMYRVMVMKR